MDGEVAHSPEEAMAITTEFGVPVAVKSQVLTGGRGKAGGIKFADTPGEAYQEADELLGSKIKGETVNHLLIEKKAEIQKEFFLSITIDRANKLPIIMASAEGGMEIEELAKTQPEKIIRYHVDPLREFFPFEAREIARKMGVASNLIQGIGGMIWKLYNVFEKQLHGLHVYKHKDTGEYKFVPYELTKYPRVWWTSGFEPRWCLSAFPSVEINKGYGLVQNPGWE